MEFQVALNQITGEARFYMGSRLMGSVVHLLNGDDWKRLDLGKMEIASNLWRDESQWRLSVYPIEPGTGYIKLNRSYPATLQLVAAAEV
jgi:hypothetical protein